MRCGLNTEEKRPLRTAVLTLGCKVSQYESRAIEEAFEKAGFCVVDRAERCDAVVVNTCTVTAESDRKCRQMIGRARRLNPGAWIAVTGCYAQNNPDEVAALPGVNYVCGSRNKLSVVERAVRHFSGGEADGVFVQPVSNLPIEPMCIHASERTRAYVKIEDGCENHCAYCTIPNARGNVVSKPAPDVIKEVSGLVASGYREVVLTGIEVASWGRDLGDERLCDLLEQVDQIPGLERIRLGSLDPSFMKQANVERLAKLKHLTPHFHLSMQSGADPVLHAMKRKYNRAMALDALERLRSAIPRVMFTTDLLFGFPGETEEDFEQTLDFMDRARFLFIHIFPYSRRKGTVADKMPGQLTQAEKARRCEIALGKMKEIRAKLMRDAVGEDVTVLFETYQDGYAVGHTDNFMEVRCQSERPLHGELHQVTLTETTGEYCIGSIR